MSAVKILISGLENVGKTTLLKSLPKEETYVIAIDEKDFKLPFYHTNIMEFPSVSQPLISPNTDGNSIILVW